MTSDIGNDRKSLKTHSSVNPSAAEDSPDRFTDFFSRIINSETAGSSQLGGYRGCSQRAASLPTEDVGR